MRIAAFPSGVLGPVDLWALRRLASICLIVAIYFLTNEANWGSATEFSREFPGWVGRYSAIYSQLLP